MAGIVEIGPPALPAPVSGKFLWPLLVINDGRDTQNGVVVIVGEEVVLTIEGVGEPIQRRTSQQLSEVVSQSSSESIRGNGDAPFGSRVNAHKVFEVMPHISGTGNRGRVAALYGREFRGCQIYDEMSQRRNCMLVWEGLHGSVVAPME